ncbi:MAG: response regulator [Lachnospiraceae bacterium]|nr:response regulator [Lachnospiraceae bacterium]
MTDYLHNEMRKLSHVVLVITVSAFSIVLVLLNITQGWEKWSIPILCVFAAASFMMHLSRRPAETDRIYIYTVILCIQLFYYITNVKEVYYCAPVILLLIILLGMAKEKRIVFACAVTGTAGLIIRIVTDGMPGRLFWQIIVIWISSFVMSRFIDETGRTEEAYGRYIYQLKTQNKSADDFLANVSHEIRTPVNAVIGLTGVCLEKEEDPEKKEKLMMVSEAGHRLSEQISDILDYSEIERDALAVNPEDYRLATVVNDLLEELKIYKHPGVELIIDVDPLIPSVMRTDTQKLRRILWHVITNGFKYTASGCVFVHFSAAAQDYGTNLRIDVMDTGIGMTEEEREKIYEHFYQSDSGRDRASSGLGLGMSIARGFTEALEGFITVKNNPGGGTWVRIAIPQGVVNDTPCMVLNDAAEKVVGGFFNLERFDEPFVRDAYDRFVTDAVRGLKNTMHRVDNIGSLNVVLESVRISHLFILEEEYLLNTGYLDSLTDDMTVIVVCGDDFEPGRSSRVKLLRKPICTFSIAEVLNEDEETGDQEERQLRIQGARILVVDDENMNLMVAKSVLSRYGIQAHCVSSGMEALDSCMRQEFDVVFMDYMMPKMDGIETARKIRAIPGTSKAPKMVAFTANAVSTAKEKFINEGFSAFLNKPIELNELERVLRQVLPESAFSYMEAGEEKAEESEDSIPDLEEAEDKDGFSLLEEKGIDTRKGMDYCLKDRDMYIAVMQEYHRDAVRKIKDLNDFYAEENWDEFVIRIHSVKSSSLMIGATALSGKARSLEEAAKKGDSEYIHSSYPAFLPEYEDIVRTIKEVCGDSED